jgi:hypothetical protein
MSYILVCTAVLAGLVGSVARADSAFAVLVEKDGDEVARGVATLVAPELLVTSNALLSLGDGWIVVNGKTGGQLVGTLEKSDAATDLALLRVPGLSGTPLVLARSAPPVGRPIDVFQEANKAIRGVVSATPGRSALEHTALYPASLYGAAVVNICGELVGVNSLPLKIGKRIVPAAPAIPLRAASLDAVTAALRGAGSVATVAAADCPSLEEQIADLERQARTTAEERSRLETLKQELVERNRKLEEDRDKIGAVLDQERKRTEKERRRLEKEAAEREAELAIQRVEQDRIRDELTAQINRERKEREAREADLSAEKQRREVQRRWFIGVAGVSALLVAIALVGFQRKRRALREQQKDASAMRAKLDKATRRFPDIVLLGHFPEGGEARLRISGDALCRAEEGQVLGRDPELAQLVIAHPEISREHARLKVVGDQLTIVDLASFNGTLVNGTRLVPKEPATVADGDRLTIGTVEMMVTILDERRP